MTRINLLPHREIKRAARQRQLNALFLGALIAGLGGTFLGHSVIAGRVEAQEARNQFLEAETAKLDRQIAQIKDLKAQTQAMIARKEVVEKLQADRPMSVHLFDELARRLPDKVYLSEVKQQGERISVRGYAQSNDRVSELLRSLEGSEWFEAPELVEVRRAGDKTKLGNEFDLNFLLKPLKAEDDTAQGETGKTGPGQTGPGKIKPAKATPGAVAGDGHMMGAST